jgi:hypothetical protein
MDCDEGTTACLIDEWTCSSSCCSEGEVCRSGGCSPYSCAAAEIVDEGYYELALEWGELEDSFDVSGTDGCQASSGADALLEVVVPAGEAVMLDIESAWNGGIHVLDGCPPTYCRSSVTSAPDGTTMWINNTADEERVYLLLESGGHDTGSGQLTVSPLTGKTCDAAIEVPNPSGGFSWTADARLFEGWSEDDLCGLSGQRHLWFAVDVDVDQQLDVMSWGRGTDFTFSPTIAVVAGACGEPTCLVVGEDVITLNNDLQVPQTLSVAIGWSAEYDGDVNVDFTRQ